MYITGKLCYALRQSPIEILGLVTKARQFKSMREISSFCGEADRMLFAYKKSSKLFTYLGRTSSEGRGGNLFLGVCLHYIFQS